MSKSIQEKIELFNKKNQSDKNIPLKEKNNIDNNPKILKKTNEKVNVNKNTEKKYHLPPITIIIQIIHPIPKKKKKIQMKEKEKKLYWSILNQVSIQKLQKKK